MPHVLPQRPFLPPCQELQEVGGSPSGSPAWEAALASTWQAKNHGSGAPHVTVMLKL